METCQKQSPPVGRVGVPAYEHVGVHMEGMHRHRYRNRVGIEKCIEK